MTNMLPFTFSPLVEADLPLLRSWLQRPHVKSIWPSPDTLDGLRDEFLPDDKYGAARPFLACLGATAVAYVQYYVISEGGASWWPDDPPNGAIGIDLFLADGNSLGQGMGTTLVRQFVDVMFDRPDVSQIRVDPRPDNARAIRCFQKVGFRVVREFTSPDGPALLMVLDGRLDR